MPVDNLETMPLTRGVSLLSTTIKGNYSPSQKSGGSVIGTGRQMSIAEFNAKFKGESNIKQQVSQTMNENKKELKKVRSNISA